MKHNIRFTKGFGFTLRVVFNIIITFSLVLTSCNPIGKATESQTAPTETPSPQTVEDEVTNNPYQPPVYTQPEARTIQDVTLPEINSSLTTMSLSLIHI